jgi:hypothetical protein
VFMSSIGNLCCRCLSVGVLTIYPIDMSASPKLDLPLVISDGGRAWQAVFCWIILTRQLLASLLDNYEFAI